MFAMLEDYDVQATRREAKEEGKLEVREEGKEENKIEVAVNIIKDWHFTLTNAIKAVKLDSERRDQVIDELRKQNIEFVE